MPLLCGVASFCVPPWRGLPFRVLFMCFRVLPGAVGAGDVAGKALVAT